MKHKILTSKKDIFIDMILKWYQKNMRDFPWRKTRHPYEILVAEVMLQKTQAASVLKTYQSFLKNYPNLKSLYNASQEELENHLLDLGLFRRRARDLKRISEILHEINQIPKSKKELIALPGIGDYMANAIKCFAFGEKIPIVDANVGRIISRFFNFEVKSAPSRDKRLFDFISEIIPENARDFNYALLDFGALICKAQNPLCNACPLCFKCSNPRNKEKET
ncbi:MAG: hypothetical protein EAX96_13855 [Candidatus Lokiarchaeota archaeon]|nr:hypothetical protein [Candidatus Lokiarchaeota archaeon]